MQTLHLDPNEQIVLVLRKHWFIFVAHFVSIGLAFMVGLGVFSFRDFAYSILDESVWEPLFRSMFLLYTLFLLGAALIIWIEQYFDIWVITNRRIIDIKQRGLFNRETAEFPIANVQDVTTEVPSMLATLLRYGNMLIQTAGERNFKVDSIPRLDDAKRVILQCSRDEREATKTPASLVRL